MSEAKKREIKFATGGRETNEFLRSEKPEDSAVQDIGQPLFITDS